MFNAPEYASFIALCRDLRLERKPFEYGDVWCFWKPVSTGPFIQGASGNEGADEFAIWIPRLDQWLAMLEEAGHGEVSLIPFMRAAMDRWGVRLTKQGGIMDFEGATREEAAAHAWCAVTGRAVTA
jgi:hypothetical protein